MLDAYKAYFILEGFYLWAFELKIHITRLPLLFIKY